MESRMTLCNMSIEGGARIGYVNPDETTFRYLEGRPYAPKGPEWEEAKRRWLAFRSDPDARYDDVVTFRAEEIAPTVTWGITPGQAIPIDGRIPLLEELPPEERPVAEEALAYMGFRPGQAIKGVPIQVAFIGSCTNARLSDLREVARHLKGHKVKKGVRAWWCRARSGWRGRPRRRGSPKSSARRGLSGGCPAAPCAWP